MSVTQFDVLANHIFTGLQSSYTPGQGYLAVFSAAGFTVPSRVTITTGYGPTSENVLTILAITAVDTTSKPNTLTVSGPVEGYSDVALPANAMVQLRSTAGQYNAITAAINALQEGTGGGAVTSVGLTVPAGLSVSGSPITAYGTIAITTALAGIVKGTGTGLIAATAAIDYVAPSGSITGNSGTVSTIAGLVAGGTNITLTGAGTTASPYTIAASGGSGTPGGSSGQVQYNSSGSFAGASGVSYSSSGTNLKITPQHTVDVAIGVQCIASQTSNSFEVRNASGGLGASIDTYGNLTISGKSGTFNETTSTIGISLGIADSARMLFCSGTSSQNWQLDNYGGTFRWFTPGVTRMSLSGSGGGLTVNTQVTVAGTSGSNMATFQAAGTFVAGVDQNGGIYPGNSTTATRPTVTTVGTSWFDTTLGIPIWWNGSHWINASALSV
jgi:hypothetical protein